MKTGIERIADERRRQVEVCGWTPGHDAEHAEGALAQAAVCYVQYAAVQEALEARGNSPAACGWDPIAEFKWPFGWDAAWWRPSADPARNMEKAGALIAAALDRRILEIAGGEPCIKGDQVQASRPCDCGVNLPPRSCAEILADILLLRHPHDEALPLTDVLPDEIAAEANQAVKRAHEDKLIKADPDRYYRCGICGELHDEQRLPSTEDASVGRSALAHYGDEPGEQQAEG